MTFQEVNWLRAKSIKLCPLLRKTVLDYYRPVRFLPCFFSKPLKILRHRFRKIPVIIQMELMQGEEYCASRATIATGCRLKHDLPLLNSFSTRVNVHKLTQLANNPGVKKIWYDRPVTAVLDTASAAVNSSSLWELGLTGKGVAVAVVDTGIYPHPDLNGRIRVFKDFVKEKSAAYDDNGHGTHVAGDIGASGLESGYAYRGPAPECQLVGVKVLNKMGSGLLSTVIKGIQWCIENKDTYGIKVINLSLGTEASENYSNDPVCAAVEAAWNAGIVVCAAAGNSGPEPRTINSPGIHPAIITVGALNDNNSTNADDFAIAEFSSRGPTVDGLNKPDVIAPGVNIISLRAPRSLLDKQNKETRVDTWYTSLSGTSMATPICAGVVAQLLEANNSLAPAQVKHILLSTATKLPVMEPNTHGNGLINAAAAAATAIATVVTE